MNLCDANARLQTVLAEAHRYHQRAGLTGCDPRLYWSFPGYANSLRKGTPVSAIIRKFETLSYTIYPDLIDVYKKRNKIGNVISPYGVALFIQAYVAMHRLYDDDTYLDIAVRYGATLSQLMVVTKSGNLGVSSPLEGDEGVNLPGGSEAAFAMLDLFDATNNPQYLAIATRIADSFFTDFNVKTVDSSRLCLDYSVAQDGKYILNANALAIGVMSEIVRRTGAQKYERLIEGVTNYLTPYLSEERLSYAGIEDNSVGRANYDVYHAGFTLRGLSHVIRRPLIPGDRIEQLISDHIAKLRTVFPNRKGLVRCVLSRPTVDVHGVAEYIRVLTELDFQIDDIPIFVKNVEYMFRDGTFYFQRGIVDNYRYLPRWGHAPMMLAISKVLLNLKDLNADVNIDMVPLSNNLEVAP